jgi:hypothetical protein
LFRRWRRWEPLFLRLFLGLLFRLLFGLYFRLFFGFLLYRRRRHCNFRRSEFLRRRWSYNLFRLFDRLRSISCSKHFG